MNYIGRAPDSKPSVNPPYKPEIETTRVGRWMSQAEYDKMVSTGEVQMSAGNKTHVSADIDAYKASKKGTIYVEFDVPVSAVYRGGNSKWGAIYGPDSSHGKFYGVFEIPDATNIEIKGRK